MGMAIMGIRSVIKQTSPLCTSVSSLAAFLPPISSHPRFLTHTHYLKCLWMHHLVITWSHKATLWVLLLSTGCVRSLGSGSCASRHQQPWQHFFPLSDCVWPRTVRGHSLPIPLLPCNALPLVVTQACSVVATKFISSSNMAPSVCKGVLAFAMFVCPRGVDRWLRGVTL